MSFAIGEYFDCYLVLVLTVCLLVLTDNNIAVCESTLFIKSTLYTLGITLIDRLIYIYI